MMSSKRCSKSFPLKLKWNMMRMAMKKMMMMKIMTLMKSMIITSVVVMSGQRKIPGML